MIAAAGGILAGACVAALLPELPPDPLPAVILAGGGSLAIVRRLATVGCLAIGFGFFSVNANAVLADRLPQRYEGVDRVVEGTVVSIPANKGGRTRFVLRTGQDIDGDNFPHLVRLTWYGPDDLPAAGERWRLKVRLRRPFASSNPGGFDYERWLLAQRIGATGYVRRSNENRRLESAGIVRLSRLRSALAGRIEGLAGTGEFHGFIQALILGHRSELSSAQYEVLRRTGTGHLLAISGLHIGIAAAFGLLCGRVIWTLALRTFSSIQIRRQSLALLFGLLSAAMYAAMAGFSLPTQRALVMLVLALGLAWLGRSYYLPRSLAVGILAVLAVDPLAPLSQGFWLSFLAVASLALCFSGRIAGASVVRSLAMSQLAIWIGLAVPTTLMFGGMPLSSSLVNLILIPFFSVVLVPTLLVATLALFPVPMAAGHLLALGAALLDWLWPVLEWCSQVPTAYTSVADAPIPVLGIAMLGALVALAPGTRNARMLVPMLLVPALAWDGGRPPTGAFDIAVLDVGHGLSTVIRTRTRTLVFDAGPKWFSGGDAGASIVAPFLLSLGVREIDMLVISHGDSDHRGGLESLTRTIPAKRLLIGDAGLSGIGTKCVAGSKWEWEGVRFEILSPAAISTMRGNDASCVMRVESDHGSVLVTGDIERRGEAALMASGAPLRATLVIAPHHGSRTSSSAEFVDAVAAKWVIFPVARHSRWGFPDKNVVARWRSVGALTWSTGQAGAVHVRFDGRRPSKLPSGWRCQARRFWRTRSCGPPASRTISGGE